MTIVPPRLALALAGASLALGMAACSPVRGHTGYIVDTDLVNSVQPGVDNRQSVQATLGKPTFAGQFDKTEWYYLARDTRNYAFAKPKVSDQITLKIAFAPDGTVASITRSDEKQVASIDPFGKTTPTLGRKRGFFEELFGNIGSVGAGGLGTNQQGGGNPDDRP